MRKLLIILFAMPAIAGCVTLFTAGFSSYDSRSLAIQTLPLFNQRTPSAQSTKSWRGDWLFRRERLELVDRELRTSKPDIMIFQEMLAKSGSPSESDRNILASGALNGYMWDAHLVREYEDTQEDQFQAVAVGLPVQVATPENSAQRAWAIGADGFLSLSILTFEDEPIYLFNVEMPSGSRNVQLWARFVEERIAEVLDTTAENCPNRVIVAGLLPLESDGTGGLTFMEKFQLKDLADGRCEVASDCFTATPLNEIFMVTSTTQAPAQTDRILVHRSAIVLSSNLTFKHSIPVPRFASQYGLSRLWPTQRFGWGGSVRLPRCDKPDLE